MIRNFSNFPNFSAMARNVLSLGRGKRKDMAATVHSVARKTWQTLGAIKTGVILLILVVIISAAGTIILQRPATDADEMQRAYSPQVLRLLDAVGLTEVFHAWWFVTLLVLVSLSIIAKDEEAALNAAERVLQKAGFSPERIVRENNFSRFGEELDPISYKTIAIAFPLLTLMIAAGAYWANRTWGSYWSWHPKETWAAITWLVYAGYLHMRATRGWSGRRAAYVAILGFAVVMFTFFGVTYLLPGLHAYA
jgi:cytochrome c-type biogenesis protein CcsB